MIQERESRRHRGLKVFVLLCAVMMIALPAMAAKGGNSTTGGKGHSGSGGTSGGSSTVTLKMVTDANGNGSPNYGDTVTFTVSTTVTDRPYVRVDCYQGSLYVYSQWAGFYADFAWPWLQNYTFSNSMWTSGAADCTATLYYNNGKAWTNIMSQGFHVDV